MNNFYKKMKGVGLSLLAAASFATTSNAQCTAEVAPWTESFSGGALPSCWENNSSGTGTSAFWKFSGAPGYGATANGRPAGSYAWNDGSTPEVANVELVTPEIDVSGLTSPELSFEWFSNNTNNPGDNVPLIIEVYDGTNWDDLDTLMGDDPLWKTEYYDLSAYSGSNLIKVRFRSNQTVTSSSAFYNDILLDEVRIANPITCHEPTDLAVSNVSATSADLTWTENNGASTWNVEWGAPGFAVGTGAHIGQSTGTNSNPLTITITPSTEYEFYVQTDCGGGDESFWSGPYAFSNTYCLPVYTSTSEFLSLIETYGAIADVSHTATSYPAGGFTDETAQVLQAYETLTFDLNSSYDPTTYSYTVRAWVDWNNDFVFDHATEMVSTSYGSSIMTQQITIPAGTPVGTYRMRVRGEYANANTLPCSSETWGSAADFTLEIITPPSCLPPTDIDTVEVTTTSVELEWTELNGATEWIIEYGTTGFVQGSGQLTSTSTNPTVISGLNPSTQYDFYVMTDCGSGDSSAWRGPFSQFTDCGIAVAPYYEAFDNAVLPQCWENLSNNTSTSANNFWKFSGTPGYGATNNGRAAGTYAWADGSSTTPDSMMLVTPEIDISQLSNPYLSFEWFSNNTNNPGDNVPLIIEVFDGTNWNLLDTLMGDDTEWMFTNFDLTQFQGNIIQVRFMVNQTFPNSLAQYNDILLDEVRVDDCVSLGGIDGSIDICRLEDTLDLNNGLITKPNGTGFWTFPSEPTFVTQDSVFNFDYLAPGSYEVYYVERYVCFDTTTATINVFDLSRAGEDGVVEVCQNEPVNLFGALSGNVDLGGEWYDYQGTLVGSQSIAANIPGSYNYEYIADNGVCPADTSIVEVTVRPDCDYLSIEGEMFADLSVYPNPATTLLNVVNPSNASELKVEMLDMNGRVVLVENQSLNNASEATLSIGHLENGVYTLRIYNNEGHKTFKVVKQ
ncbi:GEVED domain-containing protein [Brumimicrobium aurantiacum]|uniref:T9SS C-terminal target domain-containing protein n=1 Tax=Brumimicrobium aurantiacum TaxID=1737063 RepID=A0A3E1EX36_9FLAO|nr:GEVED domain-containing protein [Brumimicrobium aurantiacum]RFC54078.1 T9SS C-terminal target domain-containing protein [Brumimicrobium aurantiacum]